MFFMFSATVGCRKLSLKLHNLRTLFSLCPQAVYTIQLIELNSNESLPQIPFKKTSPVSFRTLNFLLHLIKKGISSCLKMRHDVKWLRAHTYTLHLLKTHKKRISYSHPGSKQLWNPLKYFEALLTTQEPHGRSEIPIELQPAVDKSCIQVPKRE